MPTNSYDLIVIGTDFAGLVAATLCSKRGMRVLLLSHGGAPLTYQLGPYRLPTAPLALAGLSTPGVRRVLDELHFHHALKRKLVERAQSFQFVAPDVRLDIMSDENAFTSELARELPDRAALAMSMSTQSQVLAHALDSVLSGENEFPPSGFWKRREAGRQATRVNEEALEWLAGMESHPLLRAFFRMPALASTHMGESSVNALAAARAFHSFRLGVPQVRGDWEGLRELFAERLSKGNAETRAAKVSELTFSWGKVNGVRLENGEELGATHVIAALPLTKLAPLVEHKSAKRLQQCLEGMEIAGYRYTLNLVVDEAGVPEGMSSPLLLLGDPDAPLIGDNAVAIFLEEPDDEARVVVTLSAVAPPPKEGQSLDDVFADLRVRLRERIDMVMPFLSEHILVAHAPFEATPPEGIELEPGRGFPLAPMPVWTSALEEDPFGVSAVPYSVGLKNLTVASSQVLPQLGIEGSFVAGYCAARIACDAAGKKRDYLKDEVLASGS